MYFLPFHVIIAICDMDKGDYKFNTSIVVVNNEELSPQEELVQDIISILHVFSCRLYGLRKYKRQIERDVEIA